MCVCECDKFDNGAYHCGVSSLLCIFYCCVYHGKISEEFGLVTSQVL